MTDNPCNCSNCPNWDKFFHGCKTTFYETSILGKKETIHPFMKDDGKWIIKQVGCLSHPQAREYLMKDVIKELKQLKDEKRISINIDDVIILIRSGVKP